MGTICWTIQDILWCEDSTPELIVCVQILLQTHVSFIRRINLIKYCDTDFTLIHNCMGRISLLCEGACKFFWADAFFKSLLICLSRALVCTPHITQDHEIWNRPGERFYRTTQSQWAYTLPRSSLVQHALWPRPIHDILTNLMIWYWALNSR